MQGILVPNCSVCGKPMPNFMGASLSENDLEKARCRGCSETSAATFFARRGNSLADIKPTILSWVIAQGVKDPVFAKAISLILQRAASIADSEGFFPDAMDLITIALIDVYGEREVPSTRPYRTRSYLVGTKRNAKEAKVFLLYSKGKRGNRNKMQIAPKALEILRAVD